MIVFIYFDHDDEDVVKAFLKSTEMLLNEGRVANLY